MQLSYLWGHQLICKLGRLNDALTADVAGSSAGWEIVNSEGGAECSSHDKGYFQFDTKWSDSNIELISPVDAVVDKGGLFCELDYFVPVSESVTVKGLDLGFTILVELTIFEGTLYFWFANIWFLIEKLSVQIVHINHIVIYKKDFADSESEKVDENNRA